MVKRMDNPLPKTGHCFVDGYAETGSDRWASIMGARLVASIRFCEQLSDAAGSLVRRGTEPGS